MPTYKVTECAKPLIKKSDINSLTIHERSNNPPLMLLSLTKKQNQFSNFDQLGITELDHNKPGIKSFSTVNSIQEETAATVYSTLWLSRKESRDRLRGLMMAVTRYSE